MDRPALSVAERHPHAGDRIPTSLCPGFHPSRGRRRKLAEGPTPGLFSAIGCLPNRTVTVIPAVTGSRRETGEAPDFVEKKFRNNRSDRGLNRPCWSFLPVRPALPAPQLAGARPLSLGSGFLSGGLTMAAVWTF